MASIGSLLERLGIDKDSYRVVGLLPLVYVAWADGSVQHAERRTILRLARERGWLTGGGEAILASWLAVEPSAEDFAAGWELVRALTERSRGVGAVLQAHGRASLLEACRDVAHAAGGYWGLGEAVSAEEAAALEEIAAALGLENADDEPAEPIEVPGPRGSPFVGVAFDLLRDPLGTLARAREDYGDIYKLPVGHREVIVLCRPEHAQRVLVDAADNYVRGEPFEPVRELGGENLVTAEGAVWRRLRRIAQPAFHHDHLRSLHGCVLDLTRDMLRAWETVDTIDVDAEMARLTLRVIGTLLCGQDLTDTASDAGAAMRDVMTYVAEALSPFRAPLAVPTPGNLRVKEARRKFHALVEGIIAERRASTAEHHDLLAFLMNARDPETGEGLSDAEVRAETLNFIIAGHETTAVALTWTIYLLSLHPLAAQRLDGELEEVLYGLPPGPTHLPKLEYCERVLLESMRLFPPAHAMPRTAVSEDFIDGHRIPRGATVVVAIWLMHHHPDLWDNPEGFDPDRFLPDAVSARHACAYIPFAAGPHKCIGMPLAMMEAKIILPMILQRFRLDLPAALVPQPHPRATLRPRHALPMRLVPRGQAIP